MYKKRDDSRAPQTKEFTENGNAQSASTNVKISIPRPSTETDSMNKRTQDTQGLVGDAFHRLKSLLCGLLYSHGKLLALSH